MNNSPRGSPHSLAFRVMRLCRPSLHVDTPLRFDPSDLFIGEDLFDDPIAAASELPRFLKSPSSFTSKSGSDYSSDDLTYCTRFLLNDSFDAMGFSGLLVLPQSFGAIYLGETFCSYISINNSSKFEVKDIVIKAEIQTEKQRLLLLDTSKSPVESIRVGGRYDFIVEHDVKELGAHTLVCSALYTDGDSDRKYLPQFFKFIVANPLSVRTKVRVVKDKTFLEACIENHTKSNLYMDQVDFEPSQHWSATMIKADQDCSSKDLQTRGCDEQISKLLGICDVQIFNLPVLVRSGGGIQNYLYQLKLSPNSSEQMKVEGSNVLGKLQITWRTNLGEPGRLQTQQILGNPITHKEIELQVVRVPSVIILEQPFVTDRNMGPFEVGLLHGDLHEEKSVMIIGLQTLALPQMEASVSMDFQLNMVATRVGIQKISGITLFDTSEKKSYESLPDLEIFVDSDGIAGDL